MRKSNFSCFKLLIWVFQYKQPNILIKIDSEIHNCVALSNTTSHTLLKKHRCSTVEGQRCPKAQHREKQQGSWALSGRWDPGLCPLPSAPACRQGTGSCVGWGEAIVSQEGPAYSSMLLLLCTTDRLRTQAFESQRLELVQLSFSSSENLCKFSSINHDDTSPV